MLGELKAFYKKEGRNYLPWRKTRDPYKILVSEVMLQQTQVERVIPFYTKFIKRFPTPQALANARLSDVLLLWQGLGYNRRAKYLQEAAKTIVREYKAKFPMTIEEIEDLPGVGPYTARAIAAFAYNKPEVFIETNIRTVFMYSCFPEKNDIVDAEIMPLVAEALKESKMPPREFYAALMDYGAYLKKSGVKLNTQSKHYVKQPVFKGSTRELRGALIRAVLKKPTTVSQLIKNLSRKKGEVERALKRLERDGLLRRTGSRYRLAD